MPISPLSPHYSMENPASVYDEEALTALQLAARTAGKTNEAVAAFNALETRMNGVVAAIPGQIAEDVVKHIENGEFDKAIDLYAGSLEARLNNLLSSVAPGTTTMDAEVIDIRTGVDGTKFGSAGEAVRTQLSNLKNETAYGSAHTNASPIVEFSEGNYIRLTIPGTTNIFCNALRYTGTDLTATLTNIGSYHLFGVWFNYKTNTMLLQYSFDRTPADCVMIGRVYRHEVVLYNHTHGREEFFAEHNRNQVVKVWANEPATVDTDDNVVYTLNIPLLHVYFGGTLYTIGATSLVYDTNGSTAIVRYLCYKPSTETYFVTTHSAELTQDCWIVGIWSLRTGVILNDQSEWFRGSKTPTALILGRSGSCVEFDSVNKKVTFPDDTLVLTNMYPNYYIQLAESKGNTTVSWSGFASSALGVYLNSKTGLLEIHQYSEMTQPHLYLLCSFRTNGVVDIGVPYRWDGKYFNLFNVIDSANGGDYYNVKSVAHRGYSVGAPENTLTAFRKAKEMGFKYVECDVAFTSDNIPVLLHDDTIDRTSNGSGSVASMTYTQLLNYDFGGWFGAQYKGEKIPTFEEFIRLCRNIGVHPYIELKNSLSESKVDKLIQIVKRCGMLRNVTWVSFDINNLNKVVYIDQFARVGYNCSLTQAAIETASALIDGICEPFVNANYSTITSVMAEACADRDLPLEAWTVNDPSVGVNLDRYVSGIISDSIHFGNLLREGNI